MKTENPNSMLYWWPLVKDLDIPMPKTEIVELAMSPLPSNQRGMWFEEFEVGQRITSAGRTVTESDIVEILPDENGYPVVHTAPDNEIVFVCCETRKTLKINITKFQYIKKVSWR